jgi:hypothetical protein
VIDVATDMEDVPPLSQATVWFGAERNSSANPKGGDASPIGAQNRTAEFPAVDGSSLDRL